MSTKQLLIIDNHDSFTYNLLQIVRELGVDKYHLVFPEHFDLSTINKYDKVLISPGPGLPSERKVLYNIIRACTGRMPMLGVCLGHQALAETFGAGLQKPGRIVHGESSMIRHTNDSDLFRGIPENFQAGRYHSWCVQEKAFPEVLRCTATDADGLIMAVEHRQFPLFGIQFHPESIMTPYGAQIIENWLSI